MKRQPNLFDGFLFEDFANGKAPGKGTKEKTMADGGMESVANALQKLADRIDDMMGSGGRPRGRRRDPEDEDAPESAAPARGRSRGKAHGVAFEVKVPVGRDGKMLKGLLFFDAAVRDDRDLEELADEVDRSFRTANVFSPKESFHGSVQGRQDSTPTCYSCGKRGHISSECRSRGSGGGYDRDRDYRR